MVESKAYWSYEHDLLWKSNSLNIVQEVVQNMYANCKNDYELKIQYKIAFAKIPLDLISCCKLCR